MLVMSVLASKISQTFHSRGVLLALVGISFTSINISDVNAMGPSSGRATLLQLSERSIVHPVVVVRRGGELRLGEYKQLLQRDSGRAFDVQQHQAEVEQLKAQLAGAQWNLDKTIARAPTDGYVTNLALRKGARVANIPLAPAMAFIDTSETIIGMEIPQINSRYVRAGQPVEITFKMAPGVVYGGKVETILQAIASGQTQVSDLAVAPKEIASPPFVVRIKLDDAEFSRQLPAGSTGTAAVFTDLVTLSHFIRKVLLRQVATTNFVNPF